MMWLQNQLLRTAPIKFESIFIYIEHKPVAVVVYDTLFFRYAVAYWTHIEMTAQIAILGFHKVLRLTFFSFTAHESI